MELYGKHDIPLGQFLDEYCFRQAYNCPSENCSTPMLRHIRRFVHDGSCIQVLKFYQDVKKYLRVSH
jgi:1-phosphatidylinositol-3-phosphate 5-kinase